MKAICEECGEEVVCEPGEQGLIPVATGNDNIINLCPDCAEESA